jgi:hypothetical protein
MNKTIFTVVKLVIVVIMLVAIVLQAMIMFEDGDLFKSASLEGYFKLAYVAFAIAVALAFIFFIMQIFNYTMKQFIIMAIAIVGFGVLALISNSLAAGDNLTAKFMSEQALTLESSKFIGASIVFTYILLGLAILSIFATFVLNLFK